MKTCAACGKQMAPKIVRGAEKESPAVFARRKFCDRACMAAAMRKAKPGRSALRKRAAAYRVASCAECGGTQKLDVHHKDRNPENNDPSNLRTLCHTCHMRLHHRAGEIVRRKPRSPCSICGRPSYRLGLCSTHLTRLKRHGDPYLKKRWDGYSWTLTRVEA